MNRALVIIPTYNELENLRSIARRVLAQGVDVYSVDLLVVDDNSPDGTGILADELATQDSRIHVLHRAGKEGLGAAYRAGFAWGLEQDYDVLVELDGDGSHQPEELGRLLGRMPVADVAIGSRWVAGGAVVNWPWRRALLSRAGSLYARIALGLPFRDVTGGYRAYSAQALRRIDLGSIASQGYCFQIDMLWHAYRAGLRIDEVPITFVEREFGVSKMSSRIVREAILNVTLWGLENLPSRIRAALHPALQPATEGRPMVRASLSRASPSRASPFRESLSRASPFRESLNAFLREVLSFCLVGGIGLVVDVSVFNILRVTLFTPGTVHGGPVLAKLVSTTLAIAVNWVGNRFWTFREKRREDVVREGVEFALASLAGLVVSVACLWISHYLLGFRTVLDDNVSGNLIGLALGTVVRFVLYRWWVYGHRTASAHLTSAPLASAAPQKVDAGL